MFDPVVAYDAISNNWINVAEVFRGISIVLNVYV